MKSDRYNPKFPANHDRDCVQKDWVDEKFKFRRQLNIVPVIREVPMRASNPAYSAYVLYLGLTQLEYDFETPYQDLLEFFQQVLPEHHITASYGMERSQTTVYYNDWIDEAVIRLSLDSNSGSYRSLMRSCEERIRVPRYVNAMTDYTKRFITRVV